MARNHKFFFDKDGSPKARGPASEKVLMTFLEVDVQGSDHICRDLMDDLTAVEDESDDSREFIGNAHTVTITPTEAIIVLNTPDVATNASTDTSTDTSTDVTQDSVTGAKTEAASNLTIDSAYHVPLKHFREILEDWEAFILDDQLDDPMADEDYV